MSNWQFVSYKDFVEEKDFSIGRALLNHEMSKEDRIPLTEMVEINPDSRQSYHPDGDTVSYIDVKCFSKEGKLEKIHQQNLSNLPKRATLVAKPGDLIFSLTNPARGFVAEITADIGICMINNTIAVLRPVSKSTNELLLLLKNKEVLQELTKLTEKNGKLLIKRLKEYRLPKDVGINQKVVQGDQGMDEVFQNVLSSSKAIDRENENLVPYSSLQSNWSFKFLLGEASLEVMEEVPYYELQELGTFIPSHVIYSEMLTYQKHKNAIGVVRKGNLVAENFQILEEFPYISRLYQDNFSKESELKKFDVLISKSGSTLGNVAVNFRENNRMIAEQHVAVFRPNQSLLNARYLASYFKTTHAQTLFRKLAKGKDIQSISIGTLKTIPIPVPSLKVQEHLGDEAFHKFYFG